MAEKVILRKQFCTTSMATKVLFNYIIVIFFAYGFLKAIFLLSSLDRHDHACKEKEN